MVIAQNLSAGEHTEAVLAGGKRMLVAFYRLGEDDERTMGGRP